MLYLSDYFRESAFRRVAIRRGLFFGAVAGFFAQNIAYGVLIGAGVALLVSILLPLIAYRRDLPYTRIKREMDPPFLIDVRVRFSVKSGTVGGYFLLKENSMIFLSLERGDFRLELGRGDVQSVVRDDALTVSIYLNNKQFVRLISGACETVCDVLTEEGWNVTA